MDKEQNLETSDRYFLTPYNLDVDDVNKKIKEIYNEYGFENSLKYNFDKENKSWTIKLNEYDGIKICIKDISDIYFNVFNTGFYVFYWIEALFLHKLAEKIGIRNYIDGSNGKETIDSEKYKTYEIYLGNNKYIEKSDKKILQQYKEDENTYNKLIYLMNV